MTNDRTNIVRRENTPPVERTHDKRTFLPNTDIFETNDRILLLTDMPGVDEKSITVSLEKNTLTIDGRVVEETPKNYRILQAEYSVGDYHRAFTLGEDVDRERIEATVKNGVLRLTLPKSVGAKLRKIAVRAA